MTKMTLNAKIRMLRCPAGLPVKFSVQIPGFLKVFQSIFLSFPGLASWKFQGFPGLHKIKGFPGFRIKKYSLTWAQKKRFSFNVCSKPTNKLINKQHFFETSCWGFPPFFVVRSLYSASGQQAFSVSSIVWDNKSHEAFLL